MRGFLLIAPDGTTRGRLLAMQNHLRDAVNRQGVHFTERLGAPLLAWPFGTPDEVAEAADLLRGVALPPFALASLEGRPQEDRPAEVGFRLSGAEGLQEEIERRLKQVLDPDPPQPPFVRLARISPPSRKVGAALRGSRLLGAEGPPFVAAGLEFWTQTPEGFAPQHSLSSP